MAFKRELLIASDGQSVTVNISETTLSVKNGDKKKRDVEVVLQQVIAANLREDTVEVYFLVRDKKKRLSLVKIEGKVQGGNQSAAGEWVEALMDAAYRGINRHRRLKVLVNPHGGKGKAHSVLNETVEPIFRAAGCVLDIVSTTHNGHAFDIAKDLNPDDYDAVVTLSGDGLIHEVLNGFARHKDTAKAFNIPVAPVPTGSGNGLSLNLLGLEDGFDVAAAALNAIKGSAMKIDLFSITQNGKRTVSFMSQALGLMAEVDLGTENLRWMGDTRFVVGFLRGVAAFKPCPVTLSVKVVERDKHAMAQTARSQRVTTQSDSILEERTGPLPSLKYSHDDEEGWITFDKPILFVYGGKGPYVARDFMAFPVSLPDDGLIDILVQEVSTRSEILGSMDGAAKGKSFWNDSQHYFKAHAYRMKPTSTKGRCTVDGEAYPFEEYQLEVHQRLGTVLSCHGHYVVDF